MSSWKIAWRSIRQRALASSLTGISMALGVMLVVAVLVIHGVINQSFLNNSSLGYNLVVGAKGGRLDLVLNSVYYLASRLRISPTRITRNSPRGGSSGRREGDSAVPGRHVSRISRDRHDAGLFQRTGLRRSAV